MTATSAQPFAQASQTRGNEGLCARGVQKSFQMGEVSVQVLKAVDLTVKQGEFLAIEGRSGSGKSTLLHILGALETLDRGNVEFNGRSYAAVAPPRRPLGWRILWPRTLDDWIIELAGLTFALVIGVAGSWFGKSTSMLWSNVFWSSLAPAIVSASALVYCLRLQEKRELPRALLRNSQFGFVFQFYYLLPELNVLENTLLAPSIQYSWLGFRSHRPALRQRAIEVLTQLGLEHRIKHKPSQLSGGERQRVAIARALMNQPKVLFADEPTGNLDAETGRQIMGVLEKLHREKQQTIIMVTHDRSLATRADRVLVLKDGKLEKAEV
jgi:ABC-type lipoprotein export system ATPase subunit